MTGRTIPFFNYPAQFMKQESEIMEVLREVMARGAFILQKDLKEFEEKLQTFLNVKHAFGVADGSNALLIAVIAAGVKAGDEVIVPSHTFIATAAAIHWAGATPVLADCGKDHLICPDSVESLITPKTRAIMPVHLNGRTANMARLVDIAKKHNLLIVEDAAQAMGSKFKERAAGTFGQAGTISFYPAKLLGCYGDGGAVITNDDAMAAKISMLRDHGRDVEGVIRTWGFNSRLDNVQAAVLNYKMQFFVDDLKRRRELASIYQSELGSLSEVLLPPGPDADSQHYDVYQNYEIEADERDRLKEHLKANGVGTLIQWGGKAIHQFGDLGFSKEKLPNTERMFQRCLMLPMNTVLSDSDVRYIAEQVRSFYGR